MELVPLIDLYRKGLAYRLSSCHMSSLYHSSSALKHLSTFKCRSFAFAAPTIWNYIPLALRTSSSVCPFILLSRFIFFSIAQPFSHSVNWILAGTAFALLWIAFSECIYFREKLHTSCDFSISGIPRASPTLSSDDNMYVKLYFFSFFLYA